MQEEQDPTPRPRLWTVEIKFTWLVQVVLHPGLLPQTLKGIVANFVIHNPRLMRIRREADSAAAKEVRTEVRSTIRHMAEANAAYFAMNGLAAVVAAYGLFADSTAVVIGAMLIAMLLGPIMGMALAMVDGNVRLLKSALIAEGLGVIMVLLIGIVLGRIHIDLEITNEIIVRTRPNLLDLMIAVAGGAAGAFATASPRVSAGVVGAAIATALLPPLTVVGICLSRGLFSEASGAFLLFLTNLVAIQCSASFVLYLFGYHHVTHRAADDKGYVRRLVLDGALFLVLACFLYFQLADAIRQQAFERRVREVLVRQLTRIPGANLAEVKFVHDRDAEVIVALVRAPNSITPQQTAVLEEELTKVTDREIDLHVRSLITKETTAEGYLHVIDPSEPPVDAIPGTAESKDFIYKRGSKPNGESEPNDETNPPVPPGP